MKLEDMKLKICHRTMASGNPTHCIGDKCMACIISKFSDDKEYIYTCKIN